MLRELIFMILKFIFGTSKKAVEIGAEAMDSVYGTKFSHYFLELKNYSPLESIIGLLVIVAYADKKLDNFEKSSINNTIAEFSRAGIDEDVFYKLWKNIDDFYKNEYIDECLLENYKMKNLIRKFCDNLRNIEDIKITLMYQLIAISTNGQFNKCQYKTVKYIAKLLNFSSVYVDDVLRQLGFYDKWFKSNKKNNKDEKTERNHKNPYEFLGVSENDDLETTKIKYKELVKKFHPDFISSKGLDEEFIKFANEKLKEINWAYEEIMKRFK